MRNSIIYFDSLIMDDSIKISLFRILVFFIQQKSIWLFTVEMNFGLYGTTIENNPINGL